MLNRILIPLIQTYNDQSPQVYNIDITAPSNYHKDSTARFENHDSKTGNVIALRYRNNIRFYQNNDLHESSYIVRRITFKIALDLQKREKYKVANNGSLKGWNWEYYIQVIESEYIGPTYLSTMSTRDFHDPFHHFIPAVMTWITKINRFDSTSESINQEKDEIITNYNNKAIRSLLVLGHKNKKSILSLLPGELFKETILSCFQ